MSEQEGITMNYFQNRDGSFMASLGASEMAEFLTVVGPRAGLWLAIVCFGLLIPPSVAQTRSTQCGCSDVAPIVRESPNIASLLKDFISEFARVQLELADLRIQVQQHMIPNLERQLQEVQQEQARRRNEERVYQTQLEEVDQLLAGNRGEPDERSQLEVLRSSLSGTLKDIRAALASLAQHQSELSARLYAEKDRLMAWQRKAKRD
jgi:Skp family chaperone for outer membrane proteins